MLKRRRSTDKNGRRSGADGKAKPVYNINGVIITARYVERAKIPVPRRRPGSAIVWSRTQDVYEVSPPISTVIIISFHSTLIS